MTPAQLTSKYRRLRRHGVRKQTPYSWLEKDCLIWPWRKDKKGGRAYACVDGKGAAVARYLWEIFKGPIPEGMFICHYCDNPSCVELAHLFMDTKAGNNADMKRKGRAVSPKGEADGNAKLTWPEVEEIREEYGDGNNGVLQRELAVEYDVSQTKISLIVNCVSWIPDSLGEC